MAQQLSEVAAVKQVRFEPKRRWFSALGMDLIVWVDNADQPFSFQLCYDKGAKEFALTWEVERGFNHSLVDSGESSPFKSGTPILRHDGEFDPAHIAKVFEDSSVNVPRQIRSLVVEALKLYPSSPPAPGRRPPPSLGARLSRFMKLLREQRN